ncbi:uncharacterized protein DNG_07228 [Cephalotrichum gorgonifer]|uniref:Velvet domain-containing protein n=1 Tax=Cephalotrichum gorgonifer TaxID=2041049 RepID=A0AAE8SX92_9PEZI|nr:uncharacterized protein DNG_07228 [Cephalotrichum gorgonifer]
MARPLDGWIHEPPYGASRHVGTAGYYPADQAPLRLPPPSSLMSGSSSIHDSPAHTPAQTTTSSATVTPSTPAHPLPTLHTNVKPTYGYHDYQTPSPSQQSSPPLPAPTSQPLHHVAALAHQRRHVVQDLARVSPTLSSTASERSAEDFQDARVSQVHAPQLPRIHEHQQQTLQHQPSQLPHHHQSSQLPPTLPQQQQQPYQQQPPPPPPPVRHLKRSSTEDHYQYPDMHSHPRLPPTYSQNARTQQTPQPTSPPSRQTWSPRSEPKTSQVKISDLLSSSNEELQGPPQGSSSSVVPRPPVAQTPVFPATQSEYRICVRQQPVAARSCGFGERDRRVIDPPPIVQLTIDDPSMSKEEVSQRIRYPFSVMHCSIWDSTGEQDSSAMPEDYRQQRRLMGTLVASPFVGIDENGEEGCFFCFPDLSCRTPGVFRLKFALVVIDPIASTQSGKKFPIQAQVMSDVFTVFNAKDFPGMQASTPLTKRLKEQGCLISIKKGNDKPTHGRDDSDDDGEGSSGGRRKRARRG